VNRSHQIVLIGSTIVASWLGMQAIHESGHIVGAWCTDGAVSRVILHPLTLSRTELLQNPHPLVVVWAGPALGVLLPLVIWGIAAALRMRGAFVLRFFAGFCLIANGAYIAVGSFDRIGDCGEMLQHGSPIWLLWLFGVIATPTGFWLWHRQGAGFGLGASQGQVDRRVAYGALVAALLLVVLGLSAGA